MNTRIVVLSIIGTLIGIIIGIAIGILEWKRDEEGKEETT